MIKVFISSTFSDMQSERDAIRKRVLPQIREFLKKKGQDVSFVDLRWGISGESMNSTDVMTKILSVCADEIESSKPYFVLLLGERYGTLPDKAALTTFLKRHEGAFGEGAYDKSITELETLYALGLGDGEHKLIVCQRNPDFTVQIPQELKGAYVENDEKAQMLARFKESILNSESVDVINYGASWDADKNEVCGLEDFASLLTKKLIEQMEAELGNEMTSAEHEAQAYDRFIVNSHADKYVARDDYLDDMMAFVKEKDSVLLLHGASGSGKTALMAQTAHSLQVGGECDTVSVFLGNGMYAPTIKNVLLNVIYRLNEASAPLDASISVDKLSGIAADLIEDSCKKKGLVILIDNLSALQSNERRSFLSTFPLPREGGNYKLVLSVNTVDELSVSALARNSWRDLEVAGLNEVQAKNMMESLLKEKGKELGAQARSAFCRSALFRSPLYISLGISRLMMLSQEDFKRAYEISQEENVDGNEALSIYLIRLIERFPSTEQELANTIMRQISEEYGVENHELLLSLVFITNEQLRVFDLVNIMCGLLGKSVPLLDVVNLIRCTDEILTANGASGRVQFAHASIKELVRQSALQSAPVLCDAVFKYIDALEKDDSVRIRLYLPFAVYTRSFDKAVDFIDYIRCTGKQKEAYEELYSIISSSNGGEEFFSLLEELAEFAHTMERETFNSVAEEIIGGIFDSFNQFTIKYPGIGERLLGKLYALAKRRLYVPKSGYENNRTVYRIAEKCGIVATTHEERRKYFREFFVVCSDFAANLYEDYKYKDYVLSDLGHAYGKQAMICEGEGAVEEAIDIYNEAIRVVSAEIAPSTDKKDLLEYQKATFIILKNTAFTKNQTESKRMGILSSKQISKSFNGIKSELLSVIDFSKAAIDSFNQRERLMVESEYVRVLSGAYVTLGDLCALVDDFKSEAAYLEKCLDALYEYYRVKDCMIALEGIKIIEYKLGLCKGLCPEERLKYLREANKKVKELKAFTSDEVKICGFQGQLDEIAGQMMRIIFGIIHPRVDFESKAFYDDPVGEYNKKRSEITEKNFSLAFSLCRDFLNDTRECILPQVFSYDDRYKDVVTGIHCGIRSTVLNVMGFGIHKIMKEFDEALACARRGDIKAAKERFEAFWQFVNDLSNVSLSALTGCMAVDPTVEMLDLASVAVDYAEKTAHNLRCACSELGIHSCDWSEQESRLEAEQLFLNMLKALCNGREFSYETDSLNTNVTIPLADALLFAYCINRGGKLLESYLKQSNKILKHWYNSYRAVSLAKYERAQQSFAVVGKYLCDSVDTLIGKRLMYHSNFYECVALDYAYGKGLKDVAQKIIDNGYDFYLELGTLYIMRRYDRSQYRKKFGELKRVCLRRRLYETKNGGWLTSYITNLYGEAFCKEVAALAKAAYDSIDTQNADDYRLSEKRKTPDWA